MENIKLMKTKAGKGYKIVVNGKWAYTSAQEHAAMEANKAAACTFRTAEELGFENAKKIEEAAVSPPSSVEEDLTKDDCKNCGEHFSDCVCNDGNFEECP